MMNAEYFHRLLEGMVHHQITDLHLVSGRPPLVRNQVGDITPIEGETPLSEEDILAVRTLIHPEGGHKSEEDMSYTTEKSNFRIHAFTDMGGTGIAIRRISQEVPTCEALGIPQNIVDLLSDPKGLILVTGPTGSGKSFTLASMIDHINSHQQCHIITIEDPIEFRFTEKKSLIRQRELGTHTESFPTAIRSSLRSDPDVVMVGEMRDRDTISSALTLAETGHLILSTLHTNDTVQAIDRIIDIFPVQQQPQVRMQLALSLKAVVAQMLLPRADGKGRIVAREVLINTPAIRNIILQGTTHQLYGVIELSRQNGMFLMDASLEHLYKKQAITKEVYISHLRDKTRADL